MRTAEFDIGLGRGEGEIQRINRKTIVVKMRRGGKSRVIKRHIEKHRVVFQEEE